ncbi:MAG: hypothetical protein CMJ65_10740 [Planctomycetaceae bacterium]|jgi:cell shape-determining protein MreD|nr:hypothetical protein [Planctomycetaceae bacterium]MDP7275352.1 hypothetical protein [Planctomycetaceae bacterium]
MNVFSPMRHLGLLALAYVAVVAETTLAPEWQPAGMSVRPLWIALAIAVAVCEGGAVVVWAAVLGLLSDCLRGSGPLGLDLVLAVAVVTCLPSAWTRRRLRSAHQIALVALLLIVTIDSVSQQVRAGLDESFSLLLTASLPAIVIASLGDALLTSGLLLLVVWTWRATLNSLGRLLLPTPLTS